MQNVFRPRILLGRGDGERAARIDHHHLSAALQTRNHVVQIKVGLRFHGVRAEHEDRVGQRVVLVGVVQFVHAHVARRMDLRVVGGSVMDPAVLDLHALEIELAGAPGVLVAAGAATVVEHRDHQVILGPFGHDTRSHAGHKVERVFPGGRLPDTIAPDQRIGQSLCLGAGHAARTILGHASTADRTKARVHGTVHIRLYHQLHVAPVLADDVVHRRRIPRLGVHDLLFAQIDAELVLFGCGSALTVHRPSVGLVAAADDAVVAGDVEFLRIGRDDRQAADLTLESHGSSPLMPARWTDGRRSARQPHQRRCRRCPRPAA